MAGQGGEDGLDVPWLAGEDGLLAEDDVSHGGDESPFALAHFFRAFDNQIRHSVGVVCFDELA